MTGTADAAEFLGAVITPGAAEPAEAVERLGDDKVFALITAGSMVAVSRKFTAATTVEQIQEYVGELQERFAEQASEVKPAVIERIIRATFGGGPLHGLDRDDVISTMFLLTYAIMSREGLDAGSEAAYIEKVTTMARIA